MKCWLAFLAGVLIMTSASHSRAIEFYVAPTGRDAWSGTRPARNKQGSDGPFATLKRAIEVARAHAGKERVIIRLRGGKYELDSSLVLEGLNGGDKGVFIRPYGNESVVIRGGRTVDIWSPVRNEAVRQRLAPTARPHVLQADLKALGIHDYGALTRRGFGRPVTPAALELFFQGRPMTLARWPNDEWATIKDVPEGQAGGKFTFAGGSPERWQDLSDIWVHGYWTYDWADTYEKVVSLDVATRTVTTEPPHGAYGYTPGRRFYFLNVLEELDSPGEWYVDRKQGILYFWPPAPLKKGDVVVSLLEDPLFVLRECQNVTVEGLRFECSRGQAVHVIVGRRNAIRRCEFRCLGTGAITIDWGEEHVVADCHIHDVGEWGISVSGGDRRTLVPGRHQVLRNHIHDYARTCRTYKPAVHLHGVGNRVANNVIHDAPHNAILMGGNEHVIEFNDISRVCLQTGDAGAVYMGRNMTMRGNVIRWNYFHDLRRSVTHGQGFVDVMSVYLDDCFSSAAVYGNVFVRGGRAVLIGGGRDNSVENNVFIDCSPAIHVDARGTSGFSFWFDGRDPFIMDGLKEVKHDQPPYSVRYPQLRTLLQDEPARPKGNVIRRNVCVGGKWVELFDGLDEKAVGMEDNFINGDPGFMNLEALDLRLKPDSPLRKLGFKPIPLEKIGLPSKVPTPWARGQIKRNQP